MKEDTVTLQVQLLHGMSHHMRVEMTAAAGVDLHRRHARCADALGVVGAFLIAFYDPHREVLLEAVQGFDQQRRFSCARARHKIECKHAQPGEPFAVGQGEAVILRQNAFFDLQQVRLADTPHMRPGGTLSEMDVAGVMIMSMMVVAVITLTVVVIVAVIMRTIVRVTMCGPLNADLAVTAAADFTHLHFLQTSGPAATAIRYRSFS